MSEKNTGQEGQPQEQGQTQTNETEAKARRMGWVPKEEFRGSPDKWRPAEEFVERGENEMPILKERLRHQDKQLAELTATIKQFAEYHSKVEQRSFERAVAELKAQQAQAVKDADGAEFLRVGEEIERLTREAESKAKPKVADQDPAEHPVFKAWKTRNSWYGDNPEMTAYADSMGQYIRQMKPNLEGDDFFAEVTKKVKTEFPDKFENPKRSGHGAVEGASPAPRKGGKSYADLPAEAKAACDKFVKQGLLTKEQYVSSYEWE